MLQAARFLVPEILTPQEGAVLLHYSVAKEVELEVEWVRQII